MKKLGEYIYEKLGKSSSAYKPGTIIPVMYLDDENSNGSWELGYIRFDLNKKGELGAWFRATKYMLDHDVANYDRPQKYVIVKFEDFDPKPENERKNIKKAFIKIGYGEADGNFTLL